MSPKKKDADFVIDFWPISHLNEVYKIITKILTMTEYYIIWWMDLNPVSIKEDLDGIASIQELTYAWNRQRRHGEALLKLHFAKTYNMLNWNFTFDMLRVGIWR